MFENTFNYINYGYAVFPVYSIIDGFCSCGDSECKNPGKHAKIGVGPSFASKNVQAIRSMHQFWKGSNIGIATGKISGVVVLDVDPRDCGDELLRVLSAQNEPLPKTVTAISGGNGLHYYFKYPDFDIPTKNQFKAGLDFKSDGDWIVAPPSSHMNGNKYVWQNGHGLGELEPAPLPEWLAESILVACSGLATDRKKL